jgi:predicted nucleotidyltransferase
MQHQLLLQQMVDHLKPVHGLRAIVLGGSYSSGSQRPDSDIDIGLYYDENRPLDIDQIRFIASLLNDVPNPTVTDGAPDSRSTIPPSLPRVEKCIW